MDFTSMNFGELLSALNCHPLENKIMKIENINKRIVQTKMYLFLLYIYIYIYIYIPVMVLLLLNK